MLATQSYLLNRILGRNAFKSRISARGVTIEVETVEKNGVFYINVPGMLEADPEAVERNKAMLQKAMAQGGQYKIVFVFGMGNGGRIDGKDVLAYG